MGSNPSPPAAQINILQTSRLKWRRVRATSFGIRGVDGAAWPRALLKMIDAPNAPVLLVEDNFDLAGNIQDYLEQRGWSVDYAPNGALALNRVNEP